MNNWQFFETKQTPSKMFSPAAGRTERNTPKICLPAVSKTRKKSQKCAQLKVLKHAHMKANLQFQDLCFFFREIFSKKFSGFCGPKSLGRTAPPQPCKQKYRSKKHVQPAEKLRFQVRQQIVPHLTAFWGEK